jgi:predicted SnoaL-like aldol condensation-catalyzing enzyme
MMDGLYRARDATVVDRTFSESFVQHDPRLSPTIVGLRDDVRRMVRSGDAHYDAYRVIAENDLVALHGRYTGWMSAPLAVFDLFRVRGGRIVEHWDCVRAEARLTRSGHSMLDGTKASNEDALTPESRQLVEDMMERVFLAGEPTELGSFLAGDFLIEHVPEAGDGGYGFTAWWNAHERSGSALRYKDVDQIVAEGELVFTRSIGLVGGRPASFCDLFRLERGKVAEHWGIAEVAPAR